MLSGNRVDSITGQYVLTKWGLPQEQVRGGGGGGGGGGGREEEVVVVVVVVEEEERRIVPIMSKNDPKGANCKKKETSRSDLKQYELIYNRRETNARRSNRISAQHTDNSL